MRYSKIIIFLMFIVTTSTSPVYDIKTKKYLHLPQIQNAKIGYHDVMGDEGFLVRRIIQGYLERINRDKSHDQTELKAKEFSNNMDIESLSAVRKRMTPEKTRREFPELLNCKVMYFPWPNQHIFCCQKTDTCQCPRPMGVCAKPEDEENENGKNL